MAVKILDDLCDCKPTVAEHLLEIGLERAQADDLAAIIKEEIEKDQPVTGKGMLWAYRFNSKDKTVQTFAYSRSSLSLSSSSAYCSLQLDITLF